MYDIEEYIKAVRRSVPDLDLRTAKSVIRDLLNIMRDEHRVLERVMKKVEKS